MTIEEIENLFYSDWEAIDEPQIRWLIQRVHELESERSRLSKELIKERMRVVELEEGIMRHRKHLGPAKKEFADVELYKLIEK